MRVSLRSSRVDLEHDRKRRQEHGKGRQEEVVADVDEIRLRASDRARQRARRLEPLGEAREREDGAIDAGCVVARRGRWRETVELDLVTHVRPGGNLRADLVVDAIGGVSRHVAGVGNLHPRIRRAGTSWDWLGLTCLTLAHARAAAAEERWDIMGVGRGPL